VRAEEMAAREMRTQELLRSAEVGRGGVVSGRLLLQGGKVWRLKQCTPHPASQHPTQQ
jgi:hypothetical protein